MAGRSFVFAMVAMTIMVMRLVGAVICPMSSLVGRWDVMRRAVGNGIGVAVALLAVAHRMDDGGGHLGLPLNIKGNYIFFICRTQSDQKYLRTAQIKGFVFI